MLIKILCVGDIVGAEAAGLVARKLWAVRSALDADVCIVNGENAAADGVGIDVKTAEDLLAGGADVITTGNHIWRKREIRAYLEREERLLRPANYPPGAPGSGYAVINVSSYRLLVMNILGSLYMEALGDPFAAAESILAREKGRYDIAVLDFHAEATSEKAAMAHLFDGRIQAVFGTHTHCQTNDARILPGGTGAVTDIGFTAHVESILGMKIPLILKRMTTKLPEKYEVAEGNIRLSGAVFTVDTETKRCAAAELVNMPIEK